jgi:hypothetical protein
MEYATLEYIYNNNKYQQYYILLPLLLFASPVNNFR